MFEKLRTWFENRKKSKYTKKYTDGVGALQHQMKYNPSETERIGFVMEALRDGDPRVRCEAVRQLWNLKQPLFALPHYLKALQDRHEKVRLEARVELLRIKKLLKYPESYLEEFPESDLWDLDTEINGVKKYHRIQNPAEGHHVAFALFQSDHSLNEKNDQGYTFTEYVKHLTDVNNARQIERMKRRPSK